MDPRLKPLLAALKGKKVARRIRAIDELGKLGEAARPAVQDLCLALVTDFSPAVRQGALAALEKIHPELHKSVVVLAVEAEGQKHPDAARAIGRLGQEGRAAVPVLFAHIKSVPARFPDSIGSLIGEDVEALGQIAPEDAAVQKVILDLTVYTALDRYRRDCGGPVRAAAVRTLRDLVQKHPEQAKNVTPGLITASRRMTDETVRGQAVALLGTIAENHASLRPQVAAGLIALLGQKEFTAISQLPRCGRDARDAAPILKQLKVHPVEAVRVAAADALMKIEDALASADSPPRREDSPPRSERRQPPPEDTELPGELRPIIRRLKKGTTQEKVKAAEELAGLGEKALPAARALCEAALDPSDKVSRGALEALEKVQPELQKPIFVLLVDAKASNHEDALTKLESLGEQAKPAVPVLFHRIKVCQQQLGGRQTGWGNPTLIQVTIHLLKTAAKVAPEDPAVVKTIIDSGKFTTPQAVVVRKTVRAFVTKTPFRHESVHLLGEIAEERPEHRKRIIPPLVAVLKEAVQETKADNEFQVLSAIGEVEETSTALLKCGSEAKEAFTKEVLPRLKDLQFHKSDAVRKTAEGLRQKIEDAQ